jgi:hypothetical protein
MGRPAIVDRRRGMIRPDVFLLLALLVVPAARAAGQGVIRGTVVDSAAGGPIEGAEILPLAR